MSWLAPSLLLLPCLLAAHARAAGLDVRVLNADGQPLREAVVYALPASGPSEVKGPKTATVAQVEREFSPHVSAVQTGTAVSFPNRDAILHHVYSFSPAKVFEIKLYKGKSPTEIVFDKPGVVVLGCNIHDWMIAYILVVPTPHFAKSGDDGLARLRELPAGAYELRAWHPRQREGAASQAVSLAATTEGRAAFVLEVAPRREKFKPPTDQRRY